MGSLGEVAAAHRYGLELLPSSAERHDATTSDGRLVQIEATQGNRIGISSELDHINVLLLHRDGTTEEVFNGPGSLAWSNAGRVQKTGQRPISRSTLRKLMTRVKKHDRLPTLNSP